MGEEIQNQWCVYGMISPRGFGKIVEEREDSVEILYSENQKFEPQFWKSNYVNRFTTLEEAVKEYALNTGKPEKKVMETAYQDFPSYFEKNSQE